MSTPKVTKVLINNQPILVQITEDCVELWVRGSRTRYGLSIESLWRHAEVIQVNPTQYPVTTRSKNSIVAYFVYWRRNRSYWKRVDTGEELTEAALRRAGRLEKRPVITIYGDPTERKLSSNVVL